jgi:hypothetical protein
VGIIWTSSIICYVIVTGTSPRAFKFGPLLFIWVFPYSGGYVSFVSITAGALKPILVHNGVWNPLFIRSYPPSFWWTNKLWCHGEEKLGWHGEGDEHRGMRGGWSWGRGQVHWWEERSNIVAMGWAKQALMRAAVPGWEASVAGRVGNGGDSTRESQEEKKGMGASWYW